MRVAVATLRFTRSDELTATPLPARPLNPNVQHMTADDIERHEGRGMDHITRVADSLTVAEVAQITHRSTRTILRWIESRELPAYEIQRELRVARDDLNAFLASGLRAA